MKDLMIMLKMNMDENQGRIMLTAEQSQILFDYLIELRAIESSVEEHYDTALNS